MFKFLGTELPLWIPCKIPVAERKERWSGIRFLHNCKPIQRKHQLQPGTLFRFILLRWLQPELLPGRTSIRFPIRQTSTGKLLQRGQPILQDCIHLPQKSEPIMNQSLNCLINTFLVFLVFYYFVLFDCNQVNKLLHF